MQTQIRSTATVHRIAWMIHDVSDCSCKPGVGAVTHVARIAESLTHEAARRAWNPLALTSDQAASLVDNFIVEPVTPVSH